MRGSLLTIAACLIVCVPTWSAEENAFHSLFNGTDLTGWDANPAFWRVADGCIIGHNSNRTIIIEGTAGISQKAG